MSYPVIITENLTTPCDKISLRPALMNLMEHLMDFHPSAFRMYRVSSGFHYLEIDNPDDFITDGTGLV